MSEYRFHLEKYRHGSKTDCPNCGRKRCFVRIRRRAGDGALPLVGGQMRPRAELRLPLHAAASIFGITPKRCPMMIAVQGESSATRVSPHPTGTGRTFLYSRKDCPRLFCRTMIRIRCIGICAACSGRRRPCGCSIATVSVHRQNGGGSTVSHWQTDESGKVRTGKIMLYNPTTGRRVKEPQARVSWARAELRLPDFNLRQCLFGQHLLPLIFRPDGLSRGERKVCRYCCALYAGCPLARYGRQARLLQCPDCRSPARTRCNPSARPRSDRSVA